MKGPLAVLLLGPALAAGPPPLACDAGTVRKGAAPTDGYEEWCEGKDPYGNGWKHGPARTWYDDGAPWITRTFRQGVLDGPFRELHRNGKPAREGAYATGRKVGTWRIWFESGGQEEESEWRDGVRHGRFVAWWPTGAVRTLGRHCGGSQCGRWQTFDAAGKPLGEVDYGEQKLAP